MPIKCRPARPEEAEALSTLCVRSKAHWGYDADFIELAERALRIDPAAIGEGRVFVAVDESDRPLGVAGCAVGEDGVELTHLFVEPGAARQGLGRALCGAGVDP